MNAGAINSLAANFCGDPDQTRFASKYFDALNRAQEQFAMDSRALFKDTSWSVSASDADQDLPSDFMYEERCSWDNKPLSPISRSDLHRLNPGQDWTDDTGTPSHFIIDPEQAVKEILLYPIPDAAGTLRMRYFPLPASVSSDSETPLNSSSLMAQFHLAIAAYEAWLILLGETTTPEIRAKRQDLLDIYNDGVDKATNLFKNTVSAGIKIRGNRIYG